MLSRISRCITTSPRLIQKRAISTTPKRRSDALFVVSPFWSTREMLHWSTLCSIGTLPITTLRWVSYDGFLILWRTNFIYTRSPLSSLPRIWNVRTKSLRNTLLSTRRLLSSLSSTLVNDKTRVGRALASWTMLLNFLRCHPCVFTRSRPSILCSIGEPFLGP